MAKNKKQKNRNMKTINAAAQMFELNETDLAQIEGGTPQFAGLFATLVYVLVEFYKTMQENPESYDWNWFSGGPYASDEDLLYLYATQGG